MKICLSALLLTAALPASAATIYECTDRNGNRSYSQEARKGCQASKLGKPSVYTPAPVYHTPTATPAASEQPVATDAADVASAREALQQAQQNLAEGRQVRYGNERNYARYQQRIAALEQAVAEAQQNLTNAEQSGSMR